MWHTISTVLRHAVAGVVFSWVWSFVWNTPPLFGWGSYELEGVKTSCAPNWYSRDAGNMSYIIIYFCFCFAVPFSIIMVSYSQLLWTLRQVSAVNVGLHSFTRLWKDDTCSYRPYSEVFLLVFWCPIGDQAAGIWGRQHKSCGGAGGTYGSGDGAGLPRDLAAICCHGPCCHNRLQSTYWPHRCYHSWLLG